MKAATRRLYCRYLERMVNGDIAVPAGNGILQTLERRGLVRRIATLPNNMTKWRITKDGRRARKDWRADPPDERAATLPAEDPHA